MAQPHLKPLWDRKDAVPGWARENVVKPLEALKAEYVDTHVEKIRHKVEEASSEHLFKRAAQKGVPMASAEPVTNDEETLAPSATPTPTPTPAPVEAAEPEVPQAPMMTPKPIVPPGPIIPDAPAPPPEPVASPTPPSADFDNDDGALDDFLRDLEDLTASATETAEPAPEETVVEPEPQAEETEEERAERVRLKDLETADKRADITARQKKWGVAVADEGEKQLGVLKAKIAKMRKEAAKGVVSPSGELRAELKKLMEERTRVAKGVEAYAKKLMTGAGKDQEKLFEGLVEKVNKRWLESVTAFGGKVQEWMAAQNAAEKAAVSDLC